jgi:hypothetical protein
MASQCITCRKKRPHFNYLGENVGLYCEKCALPNMVNIKKSYRCNGCKKKEKDMNELYGDFYCNKCRLLISDNWM